MPKSITDLERHNRLGFSYARAVDGWPLKATATGKNHFVSLTGRVQVSDGAALRHLALGDVALACLASFTVRDDIASGRLVPVLDELDPGNRDAFHVIYIGQGGPLSSRVRALLDYLAKTARFG